MDLCEGVWITSDVLAIETIYMHLHFLKTKDKILLDCEFIINASSVLCLGLCNDGLWSPRIRDVLSNNGSRVTRDR